MKRKDWSLLRQEILFPTHTSVKSFHLLNGWEIGQRNHRLVAWFRASSVNTATDDLQLVQFDLGGSYVVCQVTWLLSGVKTIRHLIRCGESEWQSHFIAELVVRRSLQRGKDTCARLCFLVIHVCMWTRRDPGRWWHRVSIHYRSVLLTPRCEIPLDHAHSRPHNSMQRRARRFKHQPNRKPETVVLLLSCHEIGEQRSYEARAQSNPVPLSTVDSICEILDYHEMEGVKIRFGLRLWQFGNDRM